MARHPEWFERLDAIEGAISVAPSPSLGRPEIEAAFGVGERDALRLLHRFGAERKQDALSISRSGLLTQLGALKEGGAYQAFLRQRGQVAAQLAQAREETRARQFRVRSLAPASSPAGFENLPASLTWRRAAGSPAGRFEILYENGEDLLWQLAEFLEAAGRNRPEFFRGTEPAEEDSPVS